VHTVAPPSPRVAPSLSRGVGALCRAVCDEHERRVRHGGRNNKAGAPPVPAGEVRSRCVLRPKKVPQVRFHRPARNVGNEVVFGKLMKLLRDADRFEQMQRRQRQPHLAREVCVVADGRRVPAVEPKARPGPKPQQGGKPASVQRNHHGHDDQHRRAPALRRLRCSDHQQRHDGRQHRQRQGDPTPLRLGLLTDGRHGPVHRSKVFFAGTVGGSPERQAVECADGREHLSRGV
jgi:hypothetical protein